MVIAELGRSRKGKGGKNDSLRRLLRIAGEHAAGLDRLDRTTLRRGRLCVGCQECEGEKRVEGLGWVCESCAEVLDIVFEVEIERVQEACAKIEKFIEDLEAGRL